MTQGMCWELRGQRMPAEKHFDFFVEDLLTAVRFLKYRNKIYMRNCINLARKKGNIRITEIAIGWIKHYHSVICFHMDLEIIN